MTDRTDDLIEALVKAREAKMARAACDALVLDVYSAPWTATPSGGRHRYSEARLVERRL
jgi:hypothetical protein